MNQSEDFDTFNKTKKNSQFKGKKHQSRPQTNSHNTSKDDMPQNSERELREEAALADNWKSKAMRATADLQNFQRQSQLDIQQSMKLGKKKVSRTLIPFLTAMNLAFSFAPETDDEKVLAFIETLKKSFEQVQKDLTQEEVELIVPEIGSEFDPATSDSLNAQSGDEPIVKHIVTVGLKVDGQVVQPATVMLD